MRRPAPADYLLYRHIFQAIFPPSHMARLRTLNAAPAYDKPRWGTNHLSLTLNLMRLPLLTSLLLVAGSVHLQAQHNVVWFDQPTSLKGQQ